MGENQWLTEKHYLVCPKGVMFKQMKVLSQSDVQFGGHLVATTADTMIGNAFMCMGSLAVAAPPVSALQSKAVALMASPGVGLPRMGIPPQLLLFATSMGTAKCNLSAPTRKWLNPSSNLVVNKNKGLVVGQSKLLCPSEAVMVEAVETFWAALTTSSINHLGYIADFAFCFLAGRGLGTIMSAQRQRETGYETPSLSVRLNVLGRMVSGVSVYGGNNRFNTDQNDQSNDAKLQGSGTEFSINLVSAKGGTLTCFTQGTLVHCADGIKAIEKVTKADRLWTMNELTGDRELKHIKTIHRRTTLQLMAVEMENGTLFEVTPDHHFMTERGWLPISHINAEDELINIVGNPVRIKNMESFARNSIVYNFTVEDNENYFVTSDGILVHNATYA